MLTDAERDRMNELEDRLSRIGLATREIAELSWLRLNSAPPETTADVANRLAGLTERKNK